MFKVSALHYAARYSHIDVMHVLVQNGADVNIQGDDGLTPLHYAARYHSCMLSPLALDPIRVQSCVYCLFWTNRNIVRRGNIYLSIYLIIWLYRVSHETWQLINSFECRLPYAILDIKGCLQFISFKKSFSLVYFTLKLMLL